VTYGSVLKVTPRIVTEVTGRKIHLSVNIQDGTRGNTSQNVKELPTIKNSSIVGTGYFDIKGLAVVQNRFHIIECQD
jgi:hypothetical protein